MFIDNWIGWLNVKGICQFINGRGCLNGIKFDIWQLEWIDNFCCNCEFIDLLIFICILLYVIDNGIAWHGMDINWVDIVFVLIMISYLC